ncbi:hypothetical protein LTR56_012310 [Elasticomyces elasticus]|nr:hypothetical protein LTR56_012310 [Elasticomyces elasticus]KAK3641266.1 hypothetical protein LTR22_016634 [Elasticomyces elasticus]KAK4922595.1 hypothetical protein LTR49_010122 [Elasticomyces elasticus]KAK5760768.1 hypothetical protein LTS12_009126 [Elasticomyces elasticus]
MPNVPPAPRKRVIKNKVKLGMGSPLLSASQDDIESLDPARDGRRQDRFTFDAHPLRLNIDSKQYTKSDERHPSQALQTPQPGKHANNDPITTGQHFYGASSTSGKVRNPSKQFIIIHSQHVSTPTSTTEAVKAAKHTRASHSRTAKAKPISYINDIPEQDREVVGKLSKAQRKRL